MDKCKYCNVEFIKHTNDRPLFCCRCELSYQVQVLKDGIRETKMYKAIDKICQMLVWIIDLIANGISKF